MTRKYGARIVFITEWSPLRQEPEAPYNNATSRELQRTPPPVGVAGLTWSVFQSALH